MKTAITIHYRPVCLDDIKWLEEWREVSHIFSPVLADPTSSSPGCENYIALLNAAPIGLLQIANPQSLKDFPMEVLTSNLRIINACIPDWQNHNIGCGTQMMKFAISHCFANPEVNGILVAPRANNLKAQQFVEHLGFNFVEYQRFGQDERCVYYLHHPL